MSKHESDFNLMMVHTIVQIKKAMSSASTVKGPVGETITHELMLALNALSYTVPRRYLKKFLKLLEQDWRILQKALWTANSPPLHPRKPARGPGPRRVSVRVRKVKKLALLFSMVIFLGCSEHDETFNPQLAPAKPGSGLIVVVEEGGWVDGIYEDFGLGVTYQWGDLAPYKRAAHGCGLGVLYLESTESFSGYAYPARDESQRRSFGGTKVRLEFSLPGVCCETESACQ